MLMINTNNFLLFLEFWLMRETLDRSRQPLEDISNKLEKDCFDEGEKEEECIVGRRQKLSECSEYE